MSKKLLFNFNREVIQNYTYVKYVGTIITATNTLEKPIKSAILKGQTLVNLLDMNNLKQQDSTTYIVPLPFMVSEITIIATNKTVDSSPRVALFRENGTWSKNENTSIKNNKIHYKAESGLYVKELVFITKNTSVESYSYASVEQFREQGYVLFEGNYENGVPSYFEGIQSVKMPVLTTNGKNMMPINSFTPIKYSGAFINHKVCDLKLKPNTKYTFSNKFVTNGPLNMVKLVIFDCNNTQMVTLIGNNYITFTTNTNEDYWVCIYNHDAANKIIEDIMLKEGTEYIEYEPYKSNILTVNEDVTLRSNGDIYDELNLLTGRLTQRIDENNEVLAQEVVKTVDLSILDQNENKVSSISSFNDTTHITASSETIPPIFEGYLATKEVE